MYIKGLPIVRDKSTTLTNCDRLVDGLAHGFELHGGTALLLQ